jgi:hypothetical protein
LIQGYSSGQIFANIYRRVHSSRDGGMNEMELRCLYSV